MIASLKPILDILGAPHARYRIPVFQRVYSWNHQQCNQLWADMMEAAAAGNDHFMGTLISLPENGPHADADQDNVRPADLIDGQQRLTTITLVLIALRDGLRSLGDDRRAREIDETYLHAAPGVCKLELSHADAPTLAHLVDGTALSPALEPSQFLIDNLDAFRAMIGQEPGDIDKVLRGLGCLQVVAIELGEDDAPQQVFESLNAKGRPLSTTDLLRNTLLTKYGTHEQERLFETYWTPLDEAFQQFGPEQDIYLDAALHAWAAKAAPSIHAAKRSDLYQAFKSYLMRQQGASLEELEDMLRSISTECLAFAANPDGTDARRHLDWATEKPEGMISKRKLFGD